MPNKLLPLLAGIFFVSASAIAVEEPAETSDSNTWYKVQSASGSATISLGGTVIPYKEVTLSAQIPGRVKSIAGIEGDSFRSNDLLVTINDTELVAQKNSALAQLASAQAEIQNAQVQYSRELWSPRSKSSMGGMGMPNLFDQMFSRPMTDAFGDTDTDAERHADLYSSGTRIQQANNSAMRARAEIQALDAKLRDAKSVAPFDGVITTKMVEVGDTVQPGQPLLQYANVDFLQVMVDVPSRVAPVMREGDMYEAKLEHSEKGIPVRVAQVFPMADLVRHTVKVKFDLPQGVSRPGAYVKVKLPDPSAKPSGLVKIPKSSLVYRGSLPGVFVKGADNEGHLRLVRIGEFIGDTEVTVLSGVQVGDEVMRNPPVGP